jgi:hypothetical protein
MLLLQNSIFYTHLNTSGRLVYSPTYKDTNPEALYTQSPISHLIGDVTLSMMMMIGLSFICLVSS